jgi:hypothetical protein
MPWARAKRVASTATRWFMWSITFVGDLEQLPRPDNARVDHVTAVGGEHRADAVDGSSWPPTRTVKVPASAAGRAIR